MYSRSIYKEGRRNKKDVQYFSTQSLFSSMHFLQRWTKAPMPGKNIFPYLSLVNRVLPLQPLILRKGCGDEIWTIEKSDPTQKIYILKQ